MKELTEMGKRACEAKYVLGALSSEKKNAVLNRAAMLLRSGKEALLKANAEDIARARENGMKEAMIDRLTLNEKRIDGIAEGLEQVALLPDPIGEVMDHFTRPNGLDIEKVRVPLGVIGIIFESRPNVCADAFALTFKSGNAVILKGGSDALHTNLAIETLLRQALREEGVTEDAVQVIDSTDRAVTTAFMQMKEYVDVLIPRGGAGLIRSVVEHSTIPVIETGTGNCHVYVDESADLEMAVRIVVNAKTQRISVCNACESLVVHSAVKDRFLPMLKEALQPSGVEMRGDERVREVLPDIVPATEEDYGREYLDYILSLKTVDSTEEAIAHINRYNTHHSETIVTGTPEHAESFLNGVDAACVYVNASTRFTDGFEFGFGAEIGISTQKLHARGPMGLKELTSYKYKIRGNGQIRS